MDIINFKFAVKALRGQRVTVWRVCVFAVWDFGRKSKMVIMLNAWPNALGTHQPATPMVTMSMANLRATACAHFFGFFFLVARNWVFRCCRCCSQPIFSTNLIKMNQNEGKPLKCSAHIVHTFSTITTAPHSHCIRTDFSYLCTGKMWWSWNNVCDDKPLNNVAKVKVVLALKRLAKPCSPFVCVIYWHYTLEKKLCSACTEALNCVGNMTK